jgi:hypothetical protein
MADAWHCEADDNAGQAGEPLAFTGLTTAKTAMDGVFAIKQDARNRVRARTLAS